MIGGVSTIIIPPPVYNCRPRECHLPHLQLEAIIRIFREQSWKQELPTLLSALLDLAATGGCRAVNHSLPPCPSFLMYAADEITAAPPRFYDDVQGVNLWDVRGQLIQKALQCSLPIDDATLDALFDGALARFQAKETTYRIRTHIVKSFSGIASDSTASCRRASFWKCLEIFLVWCESAASASRGEFVDDIRRLIESFIDVWKLLLTKHSASDSQVCKRWASISGRVLRTIACDSSFLFSSWGFATWYEMMMRYRRSDLEPSLVASPWDDVASDLGRASQVLDNVRVQMLTGHYPSEINDLFPCLRGQAPAPPRHLVPPEHAGCEIELPGRPKLKGRIHDIGIEGRCGFQIECFGLTLVDHRVHEKDRDWTGGYVNGYKRRHASVRLDSEEKLIDVQQMAIEGVFVSPTDGPSPFRIPFGVMRSWPSFNGSRWALLAEDQFAIPEGFDEFVRAMPPGRHIGRD